MVIAVVRAAQNVCAALTSRHPSGECSQSPDWLKGTEVLCHSHVSPRWSTSPWQCLWRGDALTLSHTVPVIWSCCSWVLFCKSCTTPKGYRRGSCWESHTWPNICFQVSGISTPSRAENRDKAGTLPLGSPTHPRFSSSSRL